MGQNKFDEFIALIDEKMKKGKWAQAVRLIKKMNFEDREKYDSEIIRRLGICYYYLNLRFKAEKLLLEALNHSHTDAKIWYFLGLIYERKKDVQRALKAYSMAIRLDNNMYEAKFALAKFYFSLGLYEEATILLEELFNLNHFDTEVLGLLGECYKKLKRHQEAYKKLKRLIKLEPNNERYIMLYSEVLRLLKFDIELREYINTLKTKNPELAEKIIIGLNAHNNRLRL